MPRIRDRKAGFAATLFIACCLLLQPLTVALALSDGAARIGFDAFGNPICDAFLNHVERHRDHRRGHVRLPAFCDFGCSAFGPSLQPCDAAALPPPAVDLAERVAFRPLRQFQPSPPGHSPGDPRAPPLRT